MPYHNSADDCIKNSAEVDVDPIQSNYNMPCIRPLHYGFKGLYLHLIMQTYECLKANLINEMRVREEERVKKSGFGMESYHQKKALKPPMF